MKQSLQLPLGISLIFLSLFLLLIGICQIIPTMNVDFPCQSGLGDGPVINHDTNIAYCINSWPLNAISGGAVYATGETNQNNVTVGKLIFKRQDQILFVNNHPLQIGETYSTSQWVSSVNLWVILTTRINIVNEGIMQLPPTKPNNVLYISGDEYEGWLPNPIGPIILGLGIWLLIREIRERKKVNEKVKLK